MKKYAFEIVIASVALSTNVVAQQPVVGSGTRPLVVRDATGGPIFDDPMKMEFQYLPNISVQMLLKNGVVDYQHTLRTSMGPAQVLTFRDNSNGRPMIYFVKGDRVYVQRR